MSLKRYVHCAAMVLFLCLKALGQQSDLKSEYDSIMQLDLLYYEKDDLLTYFFRRNEKTENQKELALCYHDYAIELYKTDLKKAIDYENKAIAIRERYKDDHDAMKKSLYSLGFFYIEDGDYFNAITIYQKLVDIKEQDTRTYRAYTWLGVAYSEIGDFHKALSNYAKAQNYFEQHGEDENLFRNHINTCYAYVLMGIVEHKKEIRHHIAKADSLRARLTDSGIRISDQDLLAISQIKGNLFSDLKNDVEALKHHKKSLEIALKMKDFYEISRSYSNLGITASNLNNSKDAYVYYTNALAYAKDDPATQAIVFDNLGDYYRDKGNFEKALEYYQKAINYASGETGAVTFKMMLPMETLELSPHKLDLLTYLTDKARAWIRYYENEKNNAYLNQALSTLKLADRMVDIIRFESTETQSKLFWRQKGADIYMNAVSVCYQLDLPEEAFYFMEKNKALLLLEDLTHENAKENAGLPDKLAAREFMLKQKILLEEQELINAAARSKTKKDSLRDLVFNYKRTYEKFIDSLETQYPDYYNYRRKLAVIAYDSVLATQKENTLILHYILSETEGYGLLISGNDPCFFEIDSVSMLHKNINRLRAMLTTPFNTKEELKSYQELAFQLYNTLFPGIPQDTLTGKRLCIVPDHDLQQLPFEVLMTSPDVPDAYLLNCYEISYAYSFSFLTLNRTVQRNPANYFIGFAPVEFSPKVSLDSLPMSDEELTQIAGMFP
ncbi:MAG: tetratricopeptide repeat protein, partial [Sinomicrobium sp.]|nr:tetratricopeptide repeat protein [Sinomicrobium sp.]